MIDALVPFLIALFSLLGGGFIYQWQKKQDRKADLIQARHRAYREDLAAQQRVLTSTIRSVHDERRAAIDDLRCIEMTLYIIAAEKVVEHIAPIHDACLGYTKAIRSRYEDGYASKYNDEYNDLERRENDYVVALKKLVQAMRRDSLDEREGGENFDFRISLATGERIKQ